MILLLDTCIWMNIIEKKKLSILLVNILDLLDTDCIKIALPDVIKMEIIKNLNKVKEKRIQHFRSKLKNVRELKEIISKENSKLYENAISSFEKDISSNEEALTKDVIKINRILKHKNIINLATTDQIRLKVYDIGLNQKCPFHSKANSIADCTILEIFFNFLEKKDNVKSYFVSTDTHFTDKSNPKVPHPDINDRFINNNCEFSLNIGETLNKVKENTVDKKLVKEIDELYNFITEYLGSNVPENCIKCNTKLRQTSYHHLYGFVGWVFECPKCGKRYFEIDSDY